MKNGLQYQYMCTENHLLNKPWLVCIGKAKKCPQSSNSFVFIYLYGLHYHLLFIERHASDSDTKLADFSSCITHSWCLLGPARRTSQLHWVFGTCPGSKLYWRDYSSFFTHDELQFPGGRMVQLKTKQSLKTLKFQSDLGALAVRA